MTDNIRQHFVDYARIHVKAGDGGKGCRAFLRDRGATFGSPAGGDGGRGGSIFFEADAEMGTLLDFKMRPSWVAEQGEGGLGKNCSGRSGEDIVMKVPVGTLVYDLDKNEEIGDLRKAGERIRIARGGDGGRGNQHFATAGNKSPEKTEPGWPGEVRHLALELKVIADAGLVGLPNAGKSTMLAALTSANPKIGAYPFTTLSPNLGVFLGSDYRRRVTIADIPGLIEGAHTGAGLGARFLRHIERTAVLVHLVAPEGGMDSEGNITSADVDPEALLYAFRLVESELEQYSKLLLMKPRIVCLTKTDLMDAEEIAAVVALFADAGITINPVSAHEQSNIDSLRKLIEGAVPEEEAPAPMPIPPEPFAQ